MKTGDFTHIAQLLINGVKTFTRQGDDVATNQILEMRIGERAVIKSERGMTNVDQERVKQYEETVRKVLGGEATHYSFQSLPIEMMDGNRGLYLIIERDAA